jgi:hypothetical protein
VSVIDRVAPPVGASLQELVAATIGPALAGSQPASDTRVALRTAPAPGATSTSDAPPIAQPDPPPSIVAWLSRAVLLYGMPFEYITPDGRMLPKESLRFFYIDGNWQNSLIDGSVSVGLSSSADSIQVMANIQTLVTQAIQQTSAVRPSLQGPAAVAAAGDPVTTGPITGLLLRSAAVSGWPGMEVSAYFDDAATQKMKLLRIDRLSDDVLICLFDGLPRQVNFLQPPEGLHFGVRPTTDQSTGYMSFLRGLGYGGYQPGIQIVGAAAPLTTRGGNAKAGVLDVATSAAAVKTALQNLHALDANSTFTAAEFAVQMVRPAGRQSFQWGIPVPPTPAE